MRAEGQGASTSACTSTALIVRGHSLSLSLSLSPNEWTNGPKSGRLDFTTTDVSRRVFKKALAQSVVTRVKRGCDWLAGVTRGCDWLTGVKRECDWLRGCVAAWDT